MEPLIIEVDLDRENPIKVEVGTNDDVSYLDIRSYWQPNPGEFVRTKRGVRLALLEAPIIVDAILKAFNQVTGSHLMVVETVEEVK